MDVGAPEMLVLLVMLGLGALHFGAIVDAAIRPDAAWAAAGRSRAAWILVILFIPVLGALVYLLAVRPGATREARATKATDGSRPTTSAPPSPVGRSEPTTPVMNLPNVTSRR